MSTKTFAKKTKGENKMDIEKIIKEFGGIKDLADKLDVWPETVYNWRKWGRIPKKQLRAIDKLRGESK